MIRKTVLCILVLATLLGAQSTAGTPTALAATVTVSGTITGPGGPVPGVWIGVGSENDWRETSTNGSGFYGVTLQTEGQLWVHVRPDVSAHLVQVNRWIGGVTGDLTLDFALSEGYLLAVRPTGIGGAPVFGELWLEVQSLDEQLPGDRWYSLDWNEVTDRHQAVLPPDVYYVTVRHLPEGYYETTTAFDLRNGDMSEDLELNTKYKHPIPYDPPVAAKISIGAPDGLGEANITGMPGACLPLARVLLVNLNSGHQAHTISEADGSFEARLYAPPGSAVMVKHGPASHRWRDLEAGVSESINPFPGTILNVAHTHDVGPYQLPFAAAGAVELQADDPGTTRNYVGAAWAMSGTVGPVVVEGEWTRVLTGTYAGQTVPGLYQGGLNWTHPALGDLDGDGDLELLVGERSGHLVLYRNQGVAEMPDWHFETAEYAGVEAGGWAYPALADANGDDALDLFLGRGDGMVGIYYSEGIPLEPAWPASPDVVLPIGGNPAPALTDLDGDDDLDLLVGHEGGTLTLVRNTGTATLPDWTQESNSYGGITEQGWLQPAFVDLDDDDDLDLLAGLCGQVVWYERQGTPASPTWVRHGEDPIDYGGGSCGTSPAAGDWDDDGDLDLVIGEHWGVARFFRRDAPSGWTEQPYRFPFDLAGDSAPALGDWDDDGDLDLLVGQVWGAVHPYTNAGSKTSPDWQPSENPLVQLPWTDHPHAFPTLADIDGDLDYDLFIGEGGWPEGTGQGGNVHYYRNDGSVSSPDWTFVTDSFLGLDVGGWSTPALVDINDDGDLDLFIGDEAGTLTYVENVGMPTAPSWAAPEHPYANLHLGEYSAPAFVDMDEDGDLDLLAGLGNGSLAYVRNTGSASQPGWDLVANAYPGIDVGEHAVPVAADLDGDGLADLLLGDGDGGLNLYLNQGPGTPPDPDSGYQPGDLFQVEGLLKMYSPAISAATDVEPVSVGGWMQLMMLFDGDGQPLAAENYFMSTMLTPTGFPVQRLERPMVGLGLHLSVSDLHYAGGSAIEGAFEATGSLPDDLPPGLYRPTIWLDFAGVPTSTNWLAANVVRHTYHPSEAALPPMTVGDVEPPRLIWRLLADDFVQGTRGTGAREDRGYFELASQIVSQGAPYYTPSVDKRTGLPIDYRLEPFLPMISYTDRRMPTPPLLPFDLPGGELCVTVQKPDGTASDLGCEVLAQSFNRTKTTRGGDDLNIGTVQLEDVYSLKAASDRFYVTFDQAGHHVITMTGQIRDLWGTAYYGGGTYDVWVAHPLDIDPGVLPGTPLAVGDAFNRTVQLHPRVPARVQLTLSVYPDSDPARVKVHTVTGTANRFGYLNVEDPAWRVQDPGEYRVDVAAVYSDTAGEIYMGTMTWGGVIMTPAGDAHLVAHGRRGLDSLDHIPNFWFVSERLDIPEGAVSHTLNPYYNGDVVWSRMSDGPYGGDSLVLGASVQDAVGLVETAIVNRAARMHPPLASPGSFEERREVGELPLFTSSRSGLPPQLFARQLGGLPSTDIDQVAYSYRSSQRPGVRVREMVAEDGQSGGYWRLDTLYDDQLGVGVQGDQVNDFKFQYVGAVYRDLDSGRNEYLGQGTGWIFIPDDDPVGSRVMPPFAGYGGWTTEGGPLLTLKGEEIDLFVLPTGTHPGAVLEVGDLFRFAGHLMPTLDSKVAVTVTAPSGAQHLSGGQANPVGYYYEPDGDFAVDEPGLWSVDVSAWHDGQCSGGTVLCAYDPSEPCPSGDVLGSEAGRYWFYVVSGAEPRLNVSSPEPGFLQFDGEVTPVVISGTVPGGPAPAVVDYTISMPGYILEHGQVTATGGTYRIVFDPESLHADFPNLDLVGRDSWQAGLADTFAIGLLLQSGSGPNAVYRANAITIQGEQVFVESGPPQARHTVYLPLVSKGGRAE